MKSVSKTYAFGNFLARFNALDFNYRRGNTSEEEDKEYNLMLDILNEAGLNEQKVFHINLMCNDEESCEALSGAELLKKAAVTDCCKVPPTKEKPPSRRKLKRSSRRSPKDKG